jgi:hypothetical protein
VSATPGTERQLTGDEAVDEALSQLDGATGESLDRRIEVAQHVHDVLQSRLADLGQE